MQGWLNIQTFITVIYYINNLKVGGGDMIISLDAGKAFDKTQHPFMLKLLERK
jgi:hypothetical protein